jgi:hypothetical protein
VRPRLLRGPVQDGIDELMPIRRTKLLGQLHSFCKHHPVGQLRVRLQFMQATPQNRVLDGIEVPRCDFAQSGQAQIQCLAIWGDGFDQSLKIFQIDPIRLGVVGKLRLDILPGERIDLDLIKGLQRQPARQTAGPMGGGP